jgi:hypothetical protein
MFVAGPGAGADRSGRNRRRAAAGMSEFHILFTCYISIFYHVVSGQILFNMKNMKKLKYRKESGPFSMTVKPISPS